MQPLPLIVHRQRTLWKSPGSISLHIAVYVQPLLVKMSIMTQRPTENDSKQRQISL